MRESMRASAVEMQVESRKSEEPNSKYGRYIREKVSSLMMQESIVDIATASAVKAQIKQTGAMIKALTSTGEASGGNTEAVTR